ncbi:AMP-binding protein [Sphingomonas sp. MG17]|uniref:AMP-binding protein n=2 Tax=Sphingomonas tagetis TaxID=2949092 RepID=A0A9X2KM95_9SPHN|nr:AMP-binding protein [Sphingomonas tagetis]
MVIEHDMIGIHTSGLAITPDHSMPQVVAHVATRYGDKPFAVGEDGRVTSFAAFETRVAGLGRRLLDLGVKPGDRVAIWAPNSVEWIIAATAAECIGAIMVPVNTRFKGLEARYVLETARATALFTTGGFLGIDFVEMLGSVTGGATAGRPFADLPHLAHVIRMDEPDFAPAEVIAAARQPYAEAAAQVTPATIIDILYTSGTTGYPKGAMHNHGQAVLMVMLYNTTNDLRADDRAVVINPFFHSFGYRSGWMSALVAGMTVYPIAMFDPGQVLALIDRERISVLAGAPAIFHSLINHPDLGRYAIGSLRSGHTGGAKTPPDIIRAGYETLGFDIFLTSYGQTEATALISTNLPGDPLETIQTTVGRPLPGVEVRIVDAAGQPVQPDESGELLVRGPLVMQGYFENPTATAAAIDSDGWLHTGDVAVQQADGRLRILDRMKDVVIVGGFNAYPVEIELMLATHPAIAEVAVIGVADDRLGEVCAACVILKPGETLTLEALTAWSRERMANYKVPRALHLMEAFPRTPLSKVQKFKLVEAIHGSPPAAGTERAE